MNEAEPVDVVSEVRELVALRQTLVTELKEYNDSRSGDKTKKRSAEQSMNAAVSIRRKWADYKVKYVETTNSLFLSDHGKAEQTRCWPLSFNSFSLTHTTSTIPQPIILTMNLHLSTPSLSLLSIKTLQCVQIERQTSSLLYEQLMILPCQEPM